MPYVAKWGAQPGPLYITQWKQLTWQLFSSNLNSILLKMKGKCLSVQHTQFLYRNSFISKGDQNLRCPHPDVGKMEKQAYLQYIRTPRSQLATLSKQLAQGHTVEQLDWSTCTYLKYTVTFIYVLYFFSPTNQLGSYNWQQYYYSKFINQHATHNDTSHTKMMSNHAWVERCIHLSVACGNFEGSGKNKRKTTLQYANTHE